MMSFTLLRELVGISMHKKTRDKIVFISPVSKMALGASTEVWALSHSSVIMLVLSITSYRSSINY